MGQGASGALVHERVDVCAQQRAEAGGVSADKPVNELENGVREKPQERVDTTRDQYIDPASLVQILRTKHVRLLTAEFILDWIRGGRGPLPCRQDLPEEAFVDIDALDENQLASLIIIAVSYCWISQDHPDPNCYHLETLGLLLRCFLSSSFHSAPDKITVNAKGGWAKKELLQSQGAHFGAGGGRCVGVFLDWTGLYQDKPKGRRTSEEDEVFKRALKTINIWYAHIETVVWMLTSLPAGVQRKDYKDSGWTTFEASVASILTKGTDMLEISDEARSKLISSHYGINQYIQLSFDMMSRQSRVPSLPDDFDLMIDGKVFTNGADKDTVVKPKYAQTFHDLIPSLPAIQYKGLGLTPENVYYILDLASMHIRKLEVLDLANNAGINLPIQSFAQLPSLTTLNLACTAVSGDVGALKPLVSLERLTLNKTQVGGDVSRLQPLVYLTKLELSGTQVTGDVGPLRALVNLTDLRLGRTNVTGYVDELRTLVKLAVLALNETHVYGDVGYLRVLDDLTELWLNHTRVRGDVGKLRPLVKLKVLNLRKTSVSGDVSSLRPLVKLTLLDLFETDVPFDGSELRTLVNTTERRPGGSAWLPGSRYMLIRDIALTVHHDRPYKADGAKLREGTAVLLLELKQDSQFSARKNGSVPMGPLMGLVASKGKGGGWDYGWCALEGTASHMPVPMNGSAGHEPIGSWEVGGRYRIAGHSARRSWLSAACCGRAGAAEAPQRARQQPVAVLRKERELESEGLCELCVGEEVLALEFAAAFGNDEEQRPQPHLRAKVRTDSNQAGWLTVEMPGDVLLNPLNLYSVEAFKAGLLHAHGPIERKCVPSADGELVREGRSQAWKTGKYRVLLDTPLHFAPSVPSVRRGYARRGSLVVVEDFQIQKEGRHKLMWLQVRAEGSEPAGVSVGWITWLDTMRPPLDIRDHLEHQKYLLYLFPPSLEEGDEGVQEELAEQVPVEEAQDVAGLEERLRKWSSFIMATSPRAA